jgi:hypothetical protein
MNAIELLLNSGDTVEKVHQAAWHALLLESPLLAALNRDLERFVKGKVRWEPHGGLFDLAVEAEGRTLWIELKVDSEASEWQTERQLRHAGDDPLIHVLLGFSAYRGFPQKRGQIVRGLDVCAALESVAQADGVSAGNRELAVAYRNQLRDLAARGNDFRNHREWDVARSTYFFGQLRRACPVMTEAGGGYVANAGGGFEACHWGWRSAGGDVQCYLQWEGPKLCFKIAVPNVVERGDMRSMALAFLENRRVGPTSARRPKRSRSGATMTVGIVVDPPIYDENEWPALLEVIGAASELNAALAEHLRMSRPTA